MATRSPAQQLAHLREIRPTRITSSPVGGDDGVLAGIVKSLKQEDSTHGRIQRAMSHEMPSELAATCTGIEIQHDRLMIHVPTSAARYRLDRWLRSGGEQQLRAACRGFPSRVDISTGRFTASRK